MLENKKNSQRISNDLKFNVFDMLKYNVEQCNYNKDRNVLQHVLENGKIMEHLLLKRCFTEGTILEDLELI